MSSAYLNKQISKKTAKNRAYINFSLYMRTLWTLSGSCNCYTCGRELFLRSSPGTRAMVGHWVEGHSNVSYINEVYVKPQCYYCNIMMGGMQGEFRDKIRKELGSEVVDKLLMEAKQTLDISVTEYLDKASYYKVKLQELTK
jgi:hypothetical protein